MMMSAATAYGLLAHGLIFGALFALLPLGPLRHRAALGARLGGPQPPADGPAV